jgi:DNA-binding transcriptional MerR regulator
MAIGLIKPDTQSKGGFLLFDIRTVDTIRRIKTLQEEKRMSLEEIKEELRK